MSFSKLMTAGRLPRRLGNVEAGGLRLSQSEPDPMGAIASVPFLTAREREPRVTSVQSGIPEGPAIGMHLRGPDHVKCRTFRGTEANRRGAFPNIMYTQVA